MRDRVIGLLGWAYLAIGVATFGHAAAHADAYNEANAAECQARADSLRELGDRCRALVTPATISGLGGGIAWPLYWSWEAFS